MNNKIKDLALRAGFVGENMYPIFGTSQETALRNFAELIVEECAKVSEEHSRVYSGENNESAGCFGSANAIRVFGKSLKD